MDLRLHLVSLLLLVFVVGPCSGGFFGDMFNAGKKWLQSDDGKKAVDHWTPPILKQAANRIQRSQKKRGKSVEVTPKFKVQFALFDRSLLPDQLKNGRVLLRGSLPTWGFDARRRTQVIVHGMKQGPSTTWVQKIRRQLLHYGDYNVIVVDWSEGATSQIPRAANVRKVGGTLEKLYLALADQFQADVGNFHCIGYNLGAHVCGEFGAHLRKGKKRLDRISGLDPIGGKFVGRDPGTRLDPTDARFVDVIHTDADRNVMSGGMGIGTALPMGHFDFYPNNGHNQAGCTLHNYSPTLLQNKFDCASAKAIEYYIDSIYDNSQCHFVGFPCESGDKFSRGQCYKCGKNGCPRMGFHSSPNYRENMDDSSTKFYLSIPKERPYCMNPYHVYVKVGDDTRPDIDEEFEVVIYGLRGRTPPMKMALNGKNYDASRGHAYSAIVTAQLDVGRPTALWVKLQGRFLQGQRKLNVRGAFVTGGYAQNRTTTALFQFGPARHIIKSDVAVETFVHKYFN